MPQITIIVPVYNTELYLRQCLESILGQNFRDIEVICVDDGSTDSSPEILSACAARDGRLRIIRQENRGPSSARKAGLMAASGDYIGYVDSDDWIEPELYEKLYREAIRNRADLVTSGYFQEGAYTTTHLDNLAAGVYAGEKMAELRDHSIYCLEARETGLRASLCCKLYRRELLEKVQLPMPDQLTFSEDKMCVVSYVLECGSAVVLREAYYHYRLHAGSLVHRPRPDYLLSVHEVYQYLLKLYQHPRFTDTMRIQAELYVVEMLEKGVNTRLGFQHRNLLWTDTYWLDQLPAGARIVLCGPGELSEKYRRQLCAAKDKEYITSLEFDGWPAEPPECLAGLEYDYIVITIKNPEEAARAGKTLLQWGIGADKIRWFEQREQFWKYAQADGLLEQ